MATVGFKELSNANLGGLRVIAMTLKGHSYELLTLMLFNRPHTTFQ